MVAKLLLDNGANISSGDVGNYACTAAEENNLDLLRCIVSNGGDVTLPQPNGTTALHLAVCEGNVEMVRFLLEQGADIDKQDMQGWTPRTLADQQGHEEIKTLFQPKGETDFQPFLAAPGYQVFGKFRSEPAIRRYSSDIIPVPNEGPWGTGLRHNRRKANNFQNSLFGIMTAAHPSVTSPMSIRATRYHGMRDSPIRVTISCKEREEMGAKLVLLPSSMDDLLRLGAKKFGTLPTKVLTLDRVEVDGIELIRDGDHLLLLRDEGKEDVTDVDGG